jgi:putative phage-type endonuclease
VQTLRIKHGSPAWKEFRQTGIGGSEAAAIMGLSPWKSNIELWEEKTGMRKPKEASNILTEFGSAAEKHIAELFALDYPEYDVIINKNKVFKNGFMFASLDAELSEKATGRLGGLEIKTGELRKKQDFSRWDNRIPDNYYVQILHYMLVTGWDYWIVCARLKSFSNGKIISTTYPYVFEQKYVQSDLDLLKEKETEFWECIQSRRRPNLILPALERKII